MEKMEEWTTIPFRKVQKPNLKKRRRDGKSKISNPLSGLEPTLVLAGYSEGKATRMESNSGSSSSSTLQEQRFKVVTDSAASKPSPARPLYSAAVGSEAILPFQERLNFLKRYVPMAAFWILAIGQS
jgi:hypothetical protein